MLLWAVGAADFEPSALADMAAFGAAWFIHERLRRPPEELDELRQIAGAILGLTLSAGGAFWILFASFGAIIDSGLVIAGDQGLWEQLRVGLVLFVVGVPFFWWFWLRGLAGRPGSWRNGYAILVSIAAWFAGFTHWPWSSIGSPSGWPAFASRARLCISRQFRPAPPPLIVAVARLLAPPTGAGPGTKHGGPNRRVRVFGRRAGRRGRGRW